MKSLLLICLPLAAALYFTDIESESVLRGIVLPVLDFLLLCALALWVAGRTGWAKVDGRGGSSFGFFDGGSDGGGGD